MRRKEVSIAAGIMAALLWIVVANPAFAYDCRATDGRVLQAIEEAKRRGLNKGAAEAYCAAANIKRALIWKQLQCLNNDPTLGPRHRQLLQQQLEQLRQGLRSDLRGFYALTEGVTCSCWSNICAN